MTINEFAERIEAMPDGAFLSSDNRTDRKYIYSLIHTASAAAKKMDFLRTKRIHSSWLFPYYPEFNEQAQISSCYYKFKLPQIIGMDSRQTGLGYIGSIDCNKQYRVVENRAKFAAYQQDRVMKNRGNTVLILNGSLELYGNAKSMLIEGCWLDVTKLPNFNLEKDDYPINADLVPDVERFIATGSFAVAMKTPQDTMPDAKDNTVIANVR